MINNEKQIYIIVFILLFFNICNSQTTNTIDANTCIIASDSLSILPSSVKVYHEGTEVPNTSYYVNDNKILLERAACSLYNRDSLKIHYRTFRFRFTEEVMHLDTTSMTAKDFVVYIGYDYSPYQSTNNQALISGKGLDYNGSFTRGFSVGNSQSLVLNSNFNLQLAGDLGNDLKIVAAISDDNIPIQPEGNTQLLQEFDQVYIRLTKGKTSVVAGDYQQADQDNYFMQYFKKLKGASVTHSQKISDTHNIDTRASFAVSKGKFNRLNLVTEEGNQGPYKLVGAEGERFLIVLAGSERVYYDGVLLKRGEDYDYIIDYNRAEVTFTPRKLIARESRIIIEYEYTDQNYLRTLYTLDAKYKSKNLEISSQYYSEQDSKNGSGQANLDSMDRVILMNSGDDLLAAVTSGINSVTEDVPQGGRITYVKIDNIETPDPDDFILQYSTDSSQPLFTAIFSEVDIGRGDYVIDTSVGANGRVYTYVGPGMGTYLPIIRLIPPEQKQMLTSNVKYAVSPSTNIFGEIALSGKDLNRLSEINDDDNHGLATKVGIISSIKLDTAEYWQVSGSADYEYVQKEFQQLNPFRTPEFLRDWSLEQTTDSDELILNTKIGINIKKNFSLNYGLSTYNRVNEYDGSRHSILGSFSSHGWTIDGNINMTNSTGYGVESAFLRPKLDITKRIDALAGWTIGYGFEKERNRSNTLDNGALLDRSFNFEVHRLYMQTNSDGPLQLKAEVKTRKDDLPVQGILESAINTQEITADTRWTINQNNSLNWTIGIRDFKVNEETDIDQTSKTTILSRISYNSSIKDGFIRSTLNYDITSGQEPKQEFTYEKVESGQGDYIFIGNANTSEAEELFLYEYRPDIDTANYIKVFLYNNEFLRTNNQALNLSFRTNPSKLTKSKDSFWAKLATTHSLRLNQKIEDDGAESNFEALNFSLDNDALTSYRSFISNTIFFNRSSTAYDVQIGDRRNNSRVVQIAGFEDRVLTEYFTRIRMQAYKGIDVIFNGNRGGKQYNSTFYAVRNFDIDYYNFGPEVNYRPSGNWRIIANYTYDKRQQNIRDKESASSHDLTIESTFRQASKSSYNFKFALVNVKYNGAANTTIEYDLLDGLKDGKNYIWNFNITRRMGENVDLNISYDGRKTGTNPILHVARAQIKATF